MLSMQDRYEYDGVVKGISKGASIAMEKMLKLIKSGLTPEEALRKVNEDEDALVEAYFKD